MATATRQAPTIDERFAQLYEEREQLIEQLVVREIDGKRVPTADEISSAGLSAIDFKELVKKQRARFGDAPLAAPLAKLRAQLVAEERAAEMAREEAEREYHERLQAINTKPSDTAHRIEEAERAERRLLQTKPTWLLAEQQKIARELSKAQKILDAPLPANLETQEVTRFAPSRTARAHRDKRREELVQKKAAAELVVAGLRPIANAIRALALKAIPTREELRAILDSTPSDPVAVHDYDAFEGNDADGQSTDDFDNFDDLDDE